jgi:hypothetical protein
VHQPFAEAWTDNTDHDPVAASVTGSRALTLELVGRE